MAELAEALALARLPDPRAHAGGKLAANIQAFARLLRRAGLTVGPSEALAAMRALSLVDLADRRQVHAALRAVMVRHHAQFELFDQAFLLFWRRPAEEGDSGGAPGPGEPERAPAGARRLAEAAAPGQRQEREGERRPDEDMALTVSASERLQTMDFEAMTAEEVAAAKREIRTLVLPLDARPTRRFRPDAGGPRVDLRATLKTSLREGGEILTLARRRRVERPPPLVALCDISGSMGRYAQILLHFLHAVTNDRDRVHSFLFGTRLTNVTRQLRNRDPEVAFELVSHLVPDWQGGTRIGEALERFNRLWARRVLGQGAVVLLITDGLDRDGAAGLAEATDRLRHSCRRLIWLNPLLRYSGFQPKSQGIRAMLPHVDEFRPVHNLDSLRSLVAALSHRGSPRLPDLAPTGAASPATVPATARRKAA